MRLLYSLRLNLPQEKTANLKPVRPESQQDIETQNREYSETVQNVENYINEPPKLRINEEAVSGTKTDRRKCRIK